MFKISLYILSFLILNINSAYSSDVQTEKQNNQVKVGIDEKLDNYIPDNIILNDAEGNQVNLDQILTKPTILALVYYNCPSICSPLLMGVSEVVSRVDLKPGEEFQVVTVSFDHTEKPEDAAKWKREHLNSFGDSFPENAWRFLTGDSTNIYKLTNSVGFYFKPEKDNNFAHPASIIVISPNKKITRYIFGTDFLPFDIKMAVIEASKERAIPTVNKILDFCFSYEREGNKYVFNFTKVAGTIMLLSVFIFLAVLIIKNKVKTENKGK